MNDTNPSPEHRDVGILSNTMAAINKLPIHVGAAYVVDGSKPVLLKAEDN